MNFNRKKCIKAEETNEFINELIDKVNKSDKNQWFSNIIYILVLIFYID